GPPNAVSVMINTPLRGPLPVVFAATPTAHELPKGTTNGTPLPQLVPVTMKSPGFAPPKDRLVTVIDWLPTAESVTFWVPLWAPTRPGPKSRVEGFTASNGSFGGMGGTFTPVPETRNSMLLKNCAD